MERENMTDCELLVMKCIWDTPEELTLPDIVTLVNEKFKKDWKPQTVSTFLARLVRKGFLEMYRKGRLFLYHPKVSEKDYRGNVIKECVSFWSNDDAGLFLSALHEERKLRPDEVAKIKELLSTMKG